MPTDIPVGIHDLTFRTTGLALPHTELARHTGANPAKYHHGIGLRAMSIPAADEDIVTMAAEAAASVVERHGTRGLRTLMFATETGIDQAKAAGVYVHSLLVLPPHLRVFELQQACYGATAALQMATALVRQDPEQQVLIIASDVARYELDSPGEATQGAAAAAILVRADPALATVDRVSGVYTRDVMDFWRPNYLDTALVDGRTSLEAYLLALEGAWSDYQNQGGLSLRDLHTVCYHQPFPKMAFKAHRRLFSAAGTAATEEDVGAAVALTTGYNEAVGNSYTASVYFALACLLDSAPALDDACLGLFSYGSGSVAEFLSLRVRPGYRDALRTTEHQHAIARRRGIGYAEYRRLRSQSPSTDGGDGEAPRPAPRPYRLAGVRRHQRIYQAGGLTLTS